MFFEYAFQQNKWLWFHMLAGGIAIKIFMNWLQPTHALGAVLALAVIWEILEYVVVDIEKNYGSKQRFFADATGDILGALAVAAIVIF